MQGLEIEVIPSTFAEDLSKSAPHDYVISTARCKGREVVGRLASTGNGRRTLVVSADTVVVLDNAILEKPADEAHAVAMVSSLGGRSHNVVTGVCLFVLDEAGALVEEESFAEQTKVTFATLSDALVRAYVATGEPMCAALFACSSGLTVYLGTRPAGTASRAARARSSRALRAATSTWSASPSTASRRASPPWCSAASSSP